MHAPVELVAACLVTEFDGSFVRGCMLIQADDGPDLAEVGMRVLINTECTAGPLAGIGHYTNQLVRSVRANAGADVIDTFPGFWLRQARRVWTGLRPWLTSSSASGGISAVHQAGHLLLKGRMTAACRRGNYDLYHEPNSIPLTDEVPVVATLHDMSVLLHPEWHPVERVAHYNRCFSKGMAGCLHFLTDSRCIREEVLQVLGLPPERVTHVPLGIRPNMAPLPAAAVSATLRRLQLPPNYLLHVGTIEPRKNLQTLLRAYVELPAAVRERYPLLLVGGWGWNSADVRELLNDAQHRGVRHLGYVDEKHLPALYNGARALVFPTFYEGFGLPALEMLACGGVVLGSTAKALVEAVGGHAHLIDPHDQNGWTQAMLRVTTDAEWWLQLRTDARAAPPPYTWDQCAINTLAVYRAVHSGTTGRHLAAA